MTRLYQTPAPVCTTDSWVHTREVELVQQMKDLAKKELAVWIKVLTDMYKVAMPTATTCSRPRALRMANPDPAVFDCYEPTLTTCFAVYLVGLPYSRATSG